MRHLVRTDKPRILNEKEITWLEKFTDSGKDRPTNGNSTYAHTEVKQTLSDISYRKCFYSEVKFTNLSEAQVDHYIEVTEDKTKTFEWTNLFLSHKDSNQGKKPNSIIPNSETLNPFNDSDEEIERNLYFEDEHIRFLQEKGEKTIKKFNLDKPIFNELRLHQLKEYWKVLSAILVSIQTDQNKTEMSELDKNTLRIFSQSDSPFSLMFRLILKRNNLKL
ncbi:hypothetical protein NAL32_06595 [Chryseobacterium sp. Ch-15]|uniref:HNH endonuclease n=1 Tax=Chryseobacterium muglaense TaxID=2893752 RepID=A0A9Q3UU94_9FLAO|nr:hypothetical protein [Chryseobacterium muglaense]MBD3905803.1 hypothetical protein [Chryseobacterium muglaense]MCC9033840.1 hypothetical protein [Chryseobacterium muglaense]MCM2554060.1 hypothetical protein [Chryseobacterium muglaense]